MRVLHLMLAGLLAAGPDRAPTPAAGARAAAEAATRAGEARRRGDLPAARRLYEEALAADPGDGRAAVGLAETLTDLGDPAAAIKLLGPVVRSLAGRPEPHRALARAYLAAGQPREAAAEASRSIELDPNNSEGHVLAGRAAVAAGEAAAAVPAFERALALRAGNPQALAGLAAAYAALSDPRAESAYEKAVAADPRNLPLRVEFAEFLWRTRHFDSGNGQMDSVLREVPGNTKLRVHYGLNLADQSRFADAARQFQAARRGGDASAETLVFLGSAHWEVGRLEEAAARLREAVRLAPDNSTARHRLGRLLLFLGRPAEAAAELEEASRLSPDSAAVLLDLGRADEAAGKTSQAEAVYRRALSLEPDLEVTNYALGMLLARAGRREEAAPLIGIYQRSFQKSQEQRYLAASRRAEINLALTQLDAGRLEEALAQFSRHPDDVEAMRGSATALSRLGRHAEAVATLERASLLDPENAAVRWQLDRERERMKAP